MHLTEHIITFCAELITNLGYVGIFILMFFESMYVPIPSFAVMPFVGYVAHQHFDGVNPKAPELWLGVLVGALGGVAGSLTTYYFGKWAGPVGVRRWGRYAGLVAKDLDATQAWFEKRGKVAVFLARFIPVVRHFISTVAGLASMSLAPFVAMTFAGAFLWDLFLAMCGWHLQARYADIHTYSGPIDIAVIVIFAGGFLYLAHRLRLRIREQRRQMSAEAPAADLDAPAGSP
jgi:membrane protein DedA with SNARE-associated domain